MDTSDLLKRYPNGLSVKMKEDLKPFESLLENKSVLNVKVLANFGKDLEQSLSRGYNVYRGVVIELSGDYEMSETDKFWMHPQLFKTRALFKTSQPDIKSQLKKEFAISNFSSSSAFYTTHFFDEIGGYREENYAIIDTSNDDVASSSLNHWTSSRLKISDIYNEMYTVKVDGKTMQQHAKAEVGKIANEMGDLTVLSTSSYNVLYRSNDSYFFYNNALKPEGESALVHVSPLMGYNMISTDGKKAIAADLMASDEYLDISKFNDDQRKRAYVSCSWKGKNIINTFCLRKPIDNYKEYLGVGSVTYRMESGYFSNSNISDKLDPKIVLFLTPEATLIPEEVSVHSHVMKNIIKLPATEELLTKIVKDNWKQLFSKKYISGDNLALPRDLVKKFIN